MSKQKASSTRAANTLLNQSPGGFDSTVSFNDLLASSSLSDSYDVDDTEINFCFRKLSKKDPLTKLKSLQDLKQLYEARTEQQLAKILNSFVYHFERVALDNDKRVREALYYSLGSVAVKAKKSFAPFLRKIFPNWLEAQFDPYREVAKAAKSSFESAFAEDKRAGVLAFCRAAFFEHVAENLKHSVQTLSDMKVTTKEEAEERYDRVMFTTLMALAHFLQTEPDASKITETDGALDSGSSLWKLTQSKRPIIRKAAMTVVRVVLTNYSTLSSGPLLSVLAPIVLNFSEKEAGNLTVHWECILHLSKFYPQAWKLVKPKVVFPQLFDLLRNAAYGGGQTVYPCLLPLLSCIPPEPIKAYGEDFYKNFLAALWEGRTPPLRSGSGAVAVLRTSSTAYRAPVAAYLECLLYVFVSHKDTQPQTSDSALKDILLPLLKDTLFGAEDENDENDDASSGEERKEKKPSEVTKTRAASTGESKVPPLVYEELTKTLRVMERHAQGTTRTALWGEIGDICVGALSRKKFDPLCAKEVSLLLLSLLTDPATATEVEQVVELSQDGLAGATAVCRRVFAACFDAWRQDEYAHVSALQLMLDLLSKLPFSALVTDSEFTVQNLIPSFATLCEFPRKTSGDKEATSSEQFMKLFSQACDLVAAVTASLPNEDLIKFWPAFLGVVNKVDLSSGGKKQDKKKVTIQGESDRNLGLEMVCVVVRVLSRAPSCWCLVELDQLHARLAEEFVGGSANEAELEIYAAIFGTVFSATGDTTSESKPKRKKVSQKSSNKGKPSNKGKTEGQSQKSSSQAPFMLSKKYAQTILSSFLELVLSYSDIHHNSLLHSRGDVASIGAKFEEVNEVSSAVVPHLVGALQHALLSQALFDYASGDEGGSQNREALVRAVFWLRDSEWPALARVCVKAWNYVTQGIHSELHSHPGVVIQLAHNLRDQLVLLCKPGSDLPASTSAHATTMWATQASELVTCLVDGRLQQAVLDNLLLDRSTIDRLISTSDSDSETSTKTLLSSQRVQEISALRDAHLQLVHILGARALFLAHKVKAEASESKEESGACHDEEEFGEKRPWLLAALLCLDARLADYQTVTTVQPDSVNVQTEEHYLAHSHFGGVFEQCVREDVLPMEVLTEVIQCVLESAVRVTTSSAALDFMLGVLAADAIHRKVNLQDLRDRLSSLLVGQVFTPFLKAVDSQSKEIATQSQLRSIVAAFIPHSTVLTKPLREALLSLGRTSAQKLSALSLQNLSQALPDQSIPSASGWSFLLAFLVTASQDDSELKGQVRQILTQSVQLGKQPGNNSTIAHTASARVSLTVVSAKGDVPSYLVESALTLAASLLSFSLTDNNTNDIGQDVIGNWVGVACTALRLLSTTADGSQLRTLAPLGSLVNSLARTPSAIPHSLPLLLEGVKFLSGGVWATSTTPQESALRALCEGLSRLSDAVLGPATATSTTLPPETQSQSQAQVQAQTAVLGLLTQDPDHPSPLLQRQQEQQQLRLQQQAAAAAAVASERKGKAGKPKPAQEPPAVTAVVEPIPHPVFYGPDRGIQILATTSQEVGKDKKKKTLAPQSQPARALFELLAHPFPCVALLANRLLRVHVRTRFLNAELAAEEDVDDEETVSDPLGVEEGGGPPPEDSDGESEEDRKARVKKMEAQRKDRIKRMQARLNAQIGALLPAPLREILAAFPALTPTPSVSSSSSSLGPVPAMVLSCAQVGLSTQTLWVRGSLLCWGLLLHAVAPVKGVGTRVGITSPSGKGKGKGQKDELESFYTRKKLVSKYLREGEGLNGPSIGVIWNDLVDHITTSTPSASSSASLSSWASWSEASLVPAPSRPDIRLNALTNRLKQLRKGTGPDSDASEETEGEGRHVFFGSLASSLYGATLSTFPAFARAWWMGSPPAASKLVAALTASSFSPPIIQQELETINAVGGKGEEEAGEKTGEGQEDPEVSFKLRGNASTNEVVARYERGEISLGLVLKLPPTYPLLPLQVQLKESVKLKETQSQRWQLMITTMLASQNGSIREAVMMWKSNADKHFQGVEECPICYAVIHASTRALPRMGCRTCQNKFHSACLYKWFNTSGNSKCPLCRNLF